MKLLNISILVVSIMVGISLNGAQQSPHRSWFARLFTRCSADSSYNLTRNEQQLLAAIEEGDYQVVERLAPRVLTAACDLTITTFIDKAAQLGHSTTLKALLDEQEGYTPYALIQTARHQQRDTLEYLIKNIKDSHRMLITTMTNSSSRSSLSTSEYRQAIIPLLQHVVHASIGELIPRIPDTQRWVVQEEWERYQNTVHDTMPKKLDRDTRSLVLSYVYKL